MATKSPRAAAFDREEALKAATHVFLQRGWENTTGKDLQKAMRISAVAMADLFGDKRDVFIEALRMNSLESAARFVRALNVTLSPIMGLEQALLDFADRVSTDDEDCFGIFAMLEFGRSDPGISAAFEPSRALLTSALRRTMAEGWHSGEIATDLSVDSVVSFLGSTLIGIRTMQRNGANLAVLQDVARLAVRSLRGADRQAQARL